MEKKVKPITPKEVIKPIKPEEVIKLREKRMPNILLTALNTLISINWFENASDVLVDDILRFIAEERKKSDLPTKEIFYDYYLDIKKVYEQYGWDVSLKTTCTDCEEDNRYFVFRMKEV